MSVDVSRAGTFPIHWILLYSIAIVLAISAYKYVYAQNYDFLIESACNPAISECYIRDCDAEYCPPEGLSVYTVYRIPAAAFTSCTDNGCANICTKSDRCTELPCGEQEDIACVGPENL